LKQSQEAEDGGEQAMSLHNWCRIKNVRTLNDGIASTLCSRHSFVEQPALVLDVPANLVWPDDYSPVELAFFCLLNRDRGEQIRCTATVLPTQRHITREQHEYPQR